MTNFERITKSPEKLAEFINLVLVCACDNHGDCDECPLTGTCYTNGIKKWLKQESDTE